MTPSTVGGAHPSERGETPTLVERLREYHVSKGWQEVPSPLHDEAADEIERLQGLLTAERAAREEVERQLAEAISIIREQNAIAESAEASLKEAQQQLRSEQTAVQEALPERKAR
jgi:ribosomal protein L16 Arg81 hydroxylase